MIITFSSRTMMIHLAVTWVLTSAHRVTKTMTATASQSAWATQIIQRLRGVQQPQPMPWSLSAYPSNKIYACQSARANYQQLIQMVSTIKIKENMASNKSIIITLWKRINMSMMSIKMKAAIRSTLIRMMALIRTQVTTVAPGEIVQAPL